MPFFSRSALFLAVLSAAPTQADPVTESSEAVLRKVEVVNTAEADLGLTKTSTAGSRLGLTGLQTPASIDVISTDTIRNRGQNSVAEAVTQNGVGFTIASSPIFGSAYAARGFMGNNSIMQLFDGTRMYLGIGNVTYPFDTWSIERIEVLHGPASVLYGEGAIGGVVNVVSKRPATDAFHHEVQASVGSYDSYGLAVDSTGPLSDSLSYRISASGRDSGGWVDLGDNSNTTFAGTLRWQAAEDLAFTLSSDYGDQQPMAYFGTPLIDGRLDESLRDENYNVKNHRIRFEDSWNRLKTEWTPGEHLALTNTVYQLHSRREWRNLEVYDWDGAGRIDRSEYIHIIQSQNQVGDRFDVRLNSQVAGGDNTLVLGFDVNQADFAYTNNFYSGGGAFSGVSSVDPEHFDHGYFDAQAARKAYSSEVKQQSLFAENRYAWSAQWSAIAGVRYDHIEIERDDRRTPASSLEENFDAVSWRVGVVYNPTPTTAVYAQYATATDPVTPLLTLTPSQEQFDLSTGKQWEIGVKQSFAEGRGEVTASIFDIEKKKLLVTNPTNFFVTDQIGQQSSNGFELAASVALGDGWSVDANATWVRAKFDKFTQLDFDTFEVVSYAGNVPYEVPQRSGNLWLSWDFMPRWNARVGVQYVGKAYEDYANTQVRDAYTVTHANLSWQPVDNTTLSLQVHNLFDRVYAETWHGENQWFLGRSRTVDLVARMKF